MAPYTFVYDLEKERVSKNSDWGYGIRYSSTQRGVMVEVGDGYRHEMFIQATHWNRLLRIIRDDEVDRSGIDAIVGGLMGGCLPEKYSSRFIRAVKDGTIPLISPWKVRKV